MDTVIKIEELGNYETIEILKSRPTEITLTDKYLQVSFEFVSVEEDKNLAINKPISFEGCATYKKSAITFTHVNYLQSKEYWAVSIETPERSVVQYFKDEIDARIFHNKIVKWLYDE